MGWRRGASNNLTKNDELCGCALTPGGSAAIIWELSQCHVAFYQLFEVNYGDNYEERTH